MAITQRYLPAKSRVVVKQNAKPAVWYDTQKEVLVALPVSAQCPITNEMVQTVTISGVSIWFRPTMLRSRIVLEDGDVDPKIFDEQFSAFTYDIPASTGFSPCSELYRIAVRSTESEWLVRSGDIPYDLMGRMQDMGAKVRVRKFDRSETRSLLLDAVDMLQQKMDEATADANRSFERAALQLANSGDPESDDYLEDESKAVERFTKRTTLVQKRLDTLAKDIQQGAGTFGISTKAYGHDRLAGMRQLTANRSEAMGFAYHRATVTFAASSNLDAQALAVVAANSQVPAMVMAGMLEDIGEEAQATELADTFSLVGHGEDE